MPVVAETCPNCGSPLTLEGARCAFCMVPLVVSSAGQVSTDVPASDIDPDAAFSMQVDDVFEIKGRDTIAVGKIASGSVRVGDALVIESGGKPVMSKCTQIEMFRKQLDVAVAGTNVGIGLDGVDKRKVAKGNWLRLAPR